VKYIQVRNYLRAQATHQLAVGEAIPSERELCTQFGVARMTVRQAVDALVVEGILERVQGKGTFVAQPKVDLQVRLTSFGEEMGRRKMAPSSRLLSADTRIPPPDIADMLNLAPTDATFYLYRLRLADGEPLALSEDWIPTSLIPGLFDPVPPTSVYVAMTERGFAPEWGEDMVDADEASQDEADHLGIEPLRAVLRIARRTFSLDKALCFNRSVYRADRYTLWVPLLAPKPSVPTPASLRADTRAEGAKPAPGPQLTKEVRR